MTSSLEIPNVATLIADSWIAAESECQKQIADKYGDPDEEFVTHIFFGEFKDLVNSQSQNGQVAEAFFEDLKSSFPSCREFEKLRQISANVGAVVTKHSKQLEAESGSDIGLAISRPSIARRSSYQFGEDKRQGLLCQAKIRRRDGKWGALSGRQENSSLVKRLDYLSLLLYDFKDCHARLQLKRFGWQLCKGFKIEDLKTWLALDAFPQLAESKNTILALASGKIGTSDRKIIDEVITAEERPSFVIKIGWPDDDKPDRLLQYLDCPRQQQNIRIRQQY